MGKDTKRKMCGYCGQYRLFERRTSSTALHLLLIVFTAGLWIPVWFLVLIVEALSSYECPQCGEKG